MPRKRAGQSEPSQKETLRAGESTGAVLDCITEGVFTVDGQWRLTSMNRAAERITGIPRSEAVGRPCFEVFRADICESGCALRQTLETGKPVVERVVSIMTAKGRRVPISVNTALLKDGKGRVRGGVESFRDLSEIERLREEVRRQHSVGDMVSRSSKMQEIFAVLPRIAESGSTVLIQGESGTGKELLARAIHQLSPRNKGPLVIVNCGALPDTLLESELFGYVKGAFTDAKRNKPGRFALARGGTIFLDEIGDVSAALQVKLLRVLQEREFEPLGATRPVKADVRVIAASNQDVRKLVAEGRLREDLHYRLNVVNLALPPLRERREDIALLTELFVDRFNRARGKQIAGVSQEALAVLARHCWPGNVRELQNAIEHAFIMCRSGSIEPEHLPEELRGGDADAVRKRQQTLAESEARLIREALVRNRYERRATARELGIDRTTLYRKIRRYGIDLSKG